MRKKNTSNIEITNNYSHDISLYFHIIINHKLYRKGITTYVRHWNNKYFFCGVSSYVRIIIIHEIHCMPREPNVFLKE